MLSLKLLAIENAINLFGWEGLTDSEVVNSDLRRDIENWCFWRHQEKFQFVIGDLPFVVLCHSCGEGDIQVGLRGIKKLFCTTFCETMEKSHGCSLGEDCPYHGEKELREISLVRCSSFHRQRLVHINGPYWPMLYSKKCENECIKRVPPIKLPPPESRFSEMDEIDFFMQEQENPQSVRRKLFPED
jgi:hypothetical protein